MKPEQPIKPARAIDLSAYSQLRKPFILGGVSWALLLITFVFARYLYDVATVTVFAAGILGFVGLWRALRLADGDERFGVADGVGVLMCGVSVLLVILMGFVVFLGITA